ncbi:hypothetical protein [Pseudonocardia alni]|uniref:hypothetical protein n=1 Tax=Pseudonocardia alni TaxID=33907 RepID=UPI00280AE195|nr:hypothetical protein [Pseudonocardia alni]
MPDQRFAYVPVHDLRSGRCTGVEVVPRLHHDTVAVAARDRGWDARRIAELDAGTAVSAVASARSWGAAVPVQVDVAADTVLHARGRLRAMLGGSSDPVAPLLEVGPPIAAAAPAEHLVPALAELRRWGFRIGLDGAGRAFGPEVVAAVRAVVEVSRAVGAPVAATGVRDAARLTGLFAIGIAFAQGPLLGGRRAAPEADPATRAELLGLLSAMPQPAAHRTAAVRPVPGRPGPGHPAPERGGTPEPAATPVTVPAGPPVRGLAVPAVTLPDDAVGDTAREALRARPDSAGIVLVDRAHRPVGYLDRSRVLLQLAGRFGHALWAEKPAAELADPPRTVDERTPLHRAMEIGLSGDPARGYDDLVVVAPDGTCRGVVPVAELWRRAILPPAASGRRPVPVPQAARTA